MPPERPTTRQGLAQALFQLDPPGVNTGATGETQRGMAGRIAAAILSDLITQAQKSWRHLGPGVLTVRLIPDDVQWFTPEQLRKNLYLAEASGDADIASTLKRILGVLDDLDIKAQIPLLITSASDLRFFLIRTDNPDAELQQLLASWNANPSS